MTKSEKRQSWLDNIEENIMAYLLAPTLFLLFVQVITRYCFAFSFSWAEQVARISFVWITLAGVSACAKKDMHLKVEALTTFAPPRVSNALKTFSDVFSFLFSLFLSYKIWGIVIMQFATWQTFPSITWLPVGVMYLAGALGTLGMALRIFQLRFWPLIKARNSN